MSMSNWRNLPAGPELDALVAERVFGYRWYLHGKLGLLLPANHGGGWPTATPTDSRPSVLWPDYNTHAERKLGPLSTTWKGAGLVVEAMEARGFRLDQAGHTDGQAHRVYVFFQYRDKNHRRAPFLGEAEGIIQEAFPLAVCRAALAAPGGPA